MHPYLFKGLEAGPRTTERLLRMIDPAKMDLPTHPGRFTPREVAAHVCDWEPISRGRMQTARCSPGASVPDLDEVVIAREKKYETWDPYESAQEFIRRRAETIAFLESLSEEDWGLIAVHERRGPMTIYDYANLELGHDMYHVAQLAAVL